MKRLLALIVAFGSVATTALAAGGGEEAGHGASYVTAHTEISMGLPTLGIFLLVIVLAAIVGPRVAAKAGPHPKELDQH